MMIVGSLCFLVKNFLIYKLKLFVKVFFCFDFKGSFNFGKVMFVWKLLLLRISLIFFLKEN